MSLLRRAGLLLAGLVLLAAPATAQVTGIISGLFDSVNSIGFAVHGGVLTADPGLGGACLGEGVCGMSIEVYLDLPAPEGTTFELGLGTGFLRGFEAEALTLDLRTAVRTLPSISVYASRDHLFGSTAVVPYAGLNVGFAQLWNARAYDPAGAQYKVNAEAFEFGATLGLYFDVSPVRGLFLETAYRQRHFDSIDWAFPGEPVLPDDWPRALDLSSWVVSVGWQFRLTREE